MKHCEKQASRRKFITIGASSAAALLGGSALAGQSKAPSGLSTVTHDSVAAMKADSSLKPGDRVFTLGFYHPGDDGNNVYTVMSDDSLLDDGGSVIQLANKLKAVGVFPGGKVVVEQFGAVGDGEYDNTQAMQNAHQLGQVVFYGAKSYRFDALNITSGGVIGQGKGTRLVAIGEQDAVTFEGEGGVFKDFSLVASHAGDNQSTGLKLESPQTGGLNQVQNVMLEDFPLAIALSNSSASLVQNVISGGGVGIEITALDENAGVVINNTTFVQQQQNNIQVATAKGQVTISQNQLNGKSLKGAAILVDSPWASEAELSINNNLIRFGGGAKAVAAIHLANANGFMVNNNTVNCLKGEGHRGIYIDENCNSGILTANHVILPQNGHTLNRSKTTTEV